MAQRQINVRLPIETIEVLETAAYLEGMSSVPELIRKIVDLEAGRLRRDPHVQEVLRARAERAAMREGKLSSLEARRRQGET
jgi:hypothetical protein